MISDLHESREKVLGFLSSNRVGVLATADLSGKPHASTIYVITDSVLNFYFVTKKETQKARNLAANPRASIAIYDATSQTTVQIDGHVVEVKDEGQAAQLFTQMQGIAHTTSSSGILPVTQLSAGGYITYRLSSPSVRMATFGAKASETGQIFEEVV